MGVNTRSHSREAALVWPVHEQKAQTYIRNYLDSHTIRTTVSVATELREFRFGQDVRLNQEIFYFLP